MSHYYSTIWVEPEYRNNQDITSDLASECDLPESFNTVFTQRGLQNKEQLEQFLSPKLQYLPDPMLLPDIEIATKRVLQAIEAGERVTIYGDYDVDGVTATALLYEFLTLCEVNVSWYIPHREQEGYGLNSQAIDELIRLGTQLIITVDCGSSAVEEIQYAQKNGVDVIITDHHLLPEQAPRAVACVNPQCKHNQFPDTNLAGVGIAFHLAAAIRRKLIDADLLRPEHIDLKRFLDLVALGTVADMVPLVGPNRILVFTGLKLMSGWHRIGLHELAKVAKIYGQVSTTDIAFKMAPRLNARGRVAHANESVELLLTEDRYEAAVLAQKLEQANQSRRIIEKETTQHCVQVIAEQQDVLKKHSLILANETWHPGVVGIVASRLVEKFYRPTIVIGREGKGSGRSIPGVNIGNTLPAIENYIVRGGGHRSAIGLTWTGNDIESFRNCFEQAIEDENGSQSFVRNIAIDVVIDLLQFSDTVLQFLKELEPCGSGNAPIVFLSREVMYDDIQTFGQGHIKFIFHDFPVKEAVGYFMAGRKPTNDKPLSMVYQLEWSYFRGEEKPYFKLIDFM